MESFHLAQPSGEAATGRETVEPQPQRLNTDGLRVAIKHLNEFQQDVWMVLDRIIRDLNEELAKANAYAAKSPAQEGE